MNLKKILGSNIKKYRKIADMTQEELAEKVGISSKHLSRIEIGNTFPSSALLEKLSIALNVSPAGLFYSVDIKKIDSNEIGDIEQIVIDESDSFISRVREKIRKKYDHKDKLK